MKKINRKGGFTLIEILVVVAIIAILAAIVIVAINPAKRFRDANNAQRQANVTSIANAIGQKIVDGKGSLGCTIANLPTSDNVTAAVNIGTGGTDVSLTDLTTCLANYLSVIPTDPEGTATNTKYSIEKRTTSGGGAYTVCAPETENDSGTALGLVAEVCVTR